MTPTDPSLLLIAGVYYVIVGILTIFSIFGVYILIRYGKSTLFAFGVSVFYIFIFLSILATSYSALQAILQ